MAMLKGDTAWPPAAGEKSVAGTVRQASAVHAVRPQGTLAIFGTLIYDFDPV